MEKVIDLRKVEKWNRKFNADNIYLQVVKETEKAYQVRYAYKNYFDDGLLYNLVWIAKSGVQEVMEKEYGFCYKVWTQHNIKLMED